MKSVNEKREQAPELVAAWRALTPAQQLASLDRRLGVGIGAKRQRAKLDAILHPVAQISAVTLPGSTTESFGGSPELKPKKKFKKGAKHESA